MQCQKPDVHCSFLCLQAAAQFFIYEELERRTNWAPPGGAAGRHMLLGGIAGAVAGAITMPMDVVKTAMQCGQCRPDVLSCVKHIVRSKGPAGLFAGTFS